MNSIAQLVSGWEEWFREHGLTLEVQRILDAVLRSGTISAEGQVLALDSLAFFALTRLDDTEARHYTGRLADAIERAGVHEEDWVGRLGSKRVLLARISCDLEAAQRAVNETLPAIGANSHAGLVLRYNLATVAAGCREFGMAEAISADVLLGYAALLGVRLQELALCTEEVIARARAATNGRAVLRHSADAFLLIGDARRLSGQTIAGPYESAMALYESSDSPDSAARAAVEVADALLWAPADFDPARAVEIFESTILPSFPIPRHHLEIYSMYALALACVGRTNEAQDVFEQLAPYLPGQSPEDRAVTSHISEVSPTGLRHFQR